MVCGRFGLEPAASTFFALMATASAVCGAEQMLADGSQSGDRCLAGARSAKVYEDGRLNRRLSREPLNSRVTRPSQLIS